MKTKEIKFGVRTEKHDIDVKVKSIRRFLEEGDRVRVVVQMRGREQAHPEVAQAMLDRVVVGVELGNVVPSKLEGRSLFTIISPSSKKSRKA